MHHPSRPSGLLAFKVASLAVLIALASPAPRSLAVASAMPSSPTASRPAMVSGTFEVNGRHLFIDCIGSGSPTIILEAGESQTSTEMEGLKEALAGEATVCSYDRANTGQSDPAPTPRTARDLVDDLHGLVAAAGIPGPYVLVGHSAGGLLVQLYARTYPGDVAAVVAMNPVPPAGPWLARAVPLMTTGEAAEENAYYDGANDESLDYRTSSQQLEEAPAPRDIPFEMFISTIAQCASPTDICGKTYAVYEAVEHAVADGWPRGAFSQIDSIHSIYVDHVDAILDVIRGAIAASDIVP